MAAPKKQKSKQQQRNPITVWIVEDNTLYRNTISKLINKTRGMKCTEVFPNCESALESITKKNAPKVCLMDINLPGMNGVEGTSKFKALNYGIEIIMITVLSDNGHVYDALCAGASGYLLKASTEETIIQSIKDVVRGGSPMNPSIAKKVVTAFTHLRKPSQDLELSGREREILELMSQGLTNNQISETVYLSPHTIDSYIRRIYEKLQVHTRSGAISKMMLR
ncbi:MAG: response regulator transcription factor [Bacteroidota bacterium]